MGAERSALRGVDSVLENNGLRLMMPRPTTAALAFILSLAASLAVLPAHADKIANPSATFEGLDKITGRIISFDVAVGETVQFGSLQLTPRICYSRPPTEAANSTAFIEVNEVTLSDEYRRIFTGWVFASSPGLHAIEHPILIAPAHRGSQFDRVHRGQRGHALGRISAHLHRVGVRLQPRPSCDRASDLDRARPPRQPIRPRSSRSTRSRSRTNIGASSPGGCSPPAPAFMRSSIRS